MEFYLLVSPFSLFPLLNPLMPRATLRVVAEKCYRLVRRLRSRSITVRSLRWYITAACIFSWDDWKYRAGVCRQMLVEWYHPSGGLLSPFLFAHSGPTDSPHTIWKRLVSFAINRLGPEQSSRCWLNTPPPPFVGFLQENIPPWTDRNLFPMGFYWCGFRWTRQGDFSQAYID
jgi:hypothetical protein